jgi:hypothetical protein
MGIFDNLKLTYILHEPESWFNPYDYTYSLFVENPEKTYQEILNSRPDYARRNPEPWVKSSIWPFGIMVINPTNGWALSIFVPTSDDGAEDLIVLLRPGRSEWVELTEDAEEMFTKEFGETYSQISDRLERVLADEPGELQDFLLRLAAMLV